MISRESDYAIRMLRALTDGEKHTVKKISENECIPEKFAYKIVGKLRKKGWIRVVNGKLGGCYLNVDLHKVTLYDLLELFGDMGYVSHCLEPGHQCNWQQSHSSPCHVHKKIAELQDMIYTELRNQNLHDLIFE